MTDAANDIKLRNDPVMRIIKFICILLLNPNTQIKPPVHKEPQKKVPARGYRTSSIIKNSILLIFLLELINNKCDAFPCLMNFWK